MSSPRTGRRSGCAEGLRCRRVVISAAVVVLWNRPGHCGPSVANKWSAFRGADTGGYADGGADADSRRRQSRAGHEGELSAETTAKPLGIVAPFGGLTEGWMSHAAVT